MNKTVFVNQLNEEVQKEIYFEVMDYYLNEGYTQEETEEYTDIALDSRLSDLTDVIDINKYLKEVK